jgi:hypothetical protein
LCHAADPPARSFGLRFESNSKSKDGHFEVVDGQQRLATTSMLSAVIRDMLVAMDEGRLAGGIEEV